MTGLLRPDDKAMTEVELKLQLDASAVPRVGQWARARGGRSERLRARYYDTANRELAAAGMALRLRYERGRWVQTLKAALPGALTRFEHEVIVQRGRPDQPPAIDPAQHMTTEVAPLFAKALARGAPAALVQHFETDIRRLSVPFRSRRGTVEVSLDTGVIAAPGQTPMPVREIEIELLKGSPLAVTDVARQAVRDHACWVDPASKAERGHRLAVGLGQPAAAKAGPVQLNPLAGMREGLLVISHECRRHLLANLAQIASDQGHDAEHVHQARVALRRLRTAIRLFEYAPLQTLDPHARTLASELGVTRERDVLLESVVPELAQAGAPPVSLTALHATTDARSVVRQRASQRFVLDLLAAETAIAREVESMTAPVGSQLLGRLADWHRKVRRDARLFSTLDDASRHRLRRRMKRLRYGLEFCRTLCSDRRYRRFLRAMADAQETLGRYNDLVDALASYRAQIDSDPRAWFAVGWLTGEIKLQSQHCMTTLAALRKCEAPWKRRHLPRPSPVVAAPGAPDAILEAKESDNTTQSRSVQPSEDPSPRTP